MQQVRTESFPLHHDVLVEDVFRDARRSMVSPQGARAASDLLMCEDEMAGVVVCRCRLAALALVHAQCVADLVGILFVANRCKFN